MTQPHHTEVLKVFISHLQPEPQLVLTTVLPAHPLFLVLLPNLNAALPLLLVLSFPKVSKFLCLVH